MGLNARRELPYVELPKLLTHREAVFGSDAAAVELGIDYSLSRPTLDDFSRIGAVAAGRYVSDTISNQKNITKAEADQLAAWGKGLWLYGEQALGDFRSGRTGGQQKAELWLANEKTILSRNDGPTCYCVDDDPRGAMTLMLDWFRGIGDVYRSTFGPDHYLDLVHCYGSFYAVEACHTNGLCSDSVQTLAWSGGQWSDRSSRWQYAWTSLASGADVDLIHIRRPDYGQWAQQGGLFMTLSASQEQEVLNAARQVNTAVGKGQVDYAGTIRATLGTAQSLVNLENAHAGAIINALAADDTRIEAAIAALAASGVPTGAPADPAVFAKAVLAQLAADIQTAG